MVRVLATCAIFATFLLQEAAVAQDAGGGREDATLRQLLGEALREIKAIEEQQPKANPEFPAAPLGDLTTPHILALQAIGSAQAKLGDRDGARDTWQQAIDLASAINGLPTKAEALLEIATAQQRSGEHDAARTTLRQVNQAVRLMKGNEQFVRFRGKYDHGIMEVKASILALMGSRQAELGDRAVSEKVFRQAKEAAEAIDDHHRKVQALVEIAEAEDPGGTKTAWDRPLEVATAAEDSYERGITVEAVLRNRIRCGAFQETLRTLDSTLKGDLKAFACWIVADEIAVQARRGRTIPRAIATALADLAKNAEFDTDAKRDQVLARVANVLARSGEIKHAYETVDHLRSDDPVQKARREAARIAVMSDVAKIQFQVGDRNAAKETLRVALGILPLAQLDAQIAADLAELQVHIGDREAALRTATAADSKSTRVTALVRIILALPETGERSAVRPVIARALQAAAEIPNEVLWTRPSQELAVGEEERDDALDFLAFSASYFEKTRALKAVAVAQAKAGDIAGAYKTVESIASNVPNTPSEAPNEALRQIAMVQIKSGDFAGASKTVVPLPTDDYHYDQTAPVLESIARGQAAAGDAKGALAWALKQNSTIAKYVAVKGMAEGITERKTPRNSRPARP